MTTQTRPKLRPWVCSSFVGFFLCLLVAGWASSKEPGEGSGLEDTELDWDLRDPAQFDAMRILLSDVDVVELVQGTVGPMTLWCVDTQAGPEPGCVHHRLEFGTKAKTSSRAYILEYEAIEVAPGEHDIRLLSARFGSSPEFGSIEFPIASHRSTFNVFREVFLDPVVSSQVRQRLQAGQVELGMQFDGAHAEDWFEISVTDGINGFELFSIDALYSVETDETTLFSNG